MSLFEKFWTLKKLGLIVALLGAAKPLAEACLGIKIPDETINNLANFFGVIITIWGIFASHKEPLNDSGEDDGDAGK